MPVYQAEQRLARLIHLRNEVDLEIRQIQKDLKLREKRARRITRRRPTRDGVPIDGVQPRVIRAWALAQGLNVGQRGRVRDEIVDAYRAAHQTTGALA